MAAFQAGKNRFRNVSTPIQCVSAPAGLASTRSVDEPCVEFDFDSNANDVAAGATSIPASFIQGNAVTGSIINASGQTVASSTVGCRVKH